MKRIAIVGSTACLRASTEPVRTGSTGVGIVTGETWEVVASSAPFVAVFCTAEHLDELLAGLGKTRSAIVVLMAKADVPVLTKALEDPRIIALVAARDDQAIRAWELTYLARRIVAPTEPSPLMSVLLPWGAAMVSWKPANTRQLHKAVEQIEALCKRVGVERWQASAASKAAHELLMNAMYDAPVSREGKPLHAHDRGAAIDLATHHVPTIVFTASGDHVALDVIDPNGRLSRRRYVEGVLRGQRNLLEGTAELDTSHGGAGMGLHTLYASGALLRAELTPMKRTHVAWMLDRRISRRDRRDHCTSLIFFANVPRASG